MTPFGASLTHQVTAGQVLSLGTADADADSGLRGYMAVLGGLDVPAYLGSRATLPSKMGGHQVRFWWGEA